jgi:shikimate kinase
MVMTRHVVLLGLMGAGKTSIGRIVADRLGVQLIDGDEQLAEIAGGRTAAEIADAEGIEHLHRLEVEVAVTALDSADDAVIGPAASVCESPTARDRMAGHTVVWLTAPIDHLASKAVQKDHRPLVRDTDVVRLLTEQRERREPLVLSLDPLVIDVSQIEDAAAADLIVALARERSGRT